MKATGAVQKNQENMKSLKWLFNLSLVPTIFIIMIMVFAPPNISAESFTLDSRNPWGYSSGISEGDIPTYAQYQNAHGPYYSSPAEFEAVYLYITGNSPVRSVYFFANNCYANAGPCYAGDAITPDGKPRTWIVGYLGNNFGHVCPDGSYVEAGRSCNCQCSPAKKDNGCPCNIPGNCAAGEPISLSSGNMFEVVSDYQTAGNNSLNFTRYYNSLAATNSQATIFGAYWRSTFDRCLRLVTTSNVVTAVIVERADGQELFFGANGSNWTSDSDVSVRLAKAGSAWVITNIDNSVEKYDSGSSGVAFLQSIRELNGYTQTLQYNGTQLASVTDSFGRKLQFSYQGNVVHTVTAPNGLVLTYGYDGATRLASVTYSTTPQTSQHYLYENASVPFALTGIVDENGNRFTSWTYDSIGRATSSQHAGGADLTQVTYNDTDGSRIVTDALGSTNIYKFSLLQNVPKLQEIDRLATPTAPAAKRTFSYDQYGYQTAETDWNTNILTYGNDQYGRLIGIAKADYTGSTERTLEPV